MSRTQRVFLKQYILKHVQSWQKSGKSGDKRLFCRAIVEAPRRFEGDGGLSLLRPPAVSEAAPEQPGQIQPDPPPPAQPELFVTQLSRKRALIIFAAANRAGPRGLVYDARATFFAAAARCKSLGDFFSDSRGAAGGERYSPSSSVSAGGTSPSRPRRRSSSVIRSN